MTVDCELCIYWEEGSGLQYQEEKCCDHNFGGKLSPGPGRGGGGEGMVYFHLIVYIVQ